MNTQVKHLQSFRGEHRFVPFDSYRLNNPSIRFVELKANKMLFLIN